MTLVVVPEQSSIIQRHAKTTLQLVHAFPMPTLLVFRVEISNHVKATIVSENLVMERLLAPVLLLAANVSHPPIHQDSHVEIHNPAKSMSAAEPPAAAVSLLVKVTLLDVLVFLVRILRDLLRERISS